MKFRIWPLLLLSALTLSTLLSAIVYAADSATFSLNGSAGETKVGDEVTATVEGHNVTDVYGYEIRLSYDPDVLRFRQASAAMEGFSVPPIAEDGNLTFAHTMVGDREGESGTVTLATLRFEAIGQGDGAIRLTRVKLVNGGGSSSIAEPGSTLHVDIAQNERAGYTDTIGHWAEADIARASEMGWVNGYPDGTFAPQREITRAQFATMLARALALPSQSDMSPAPFADREQIPGYALAHVAQAVDAGWVQGYEDATFRPARSITRTEMTVMLMRVLGYEEESATNAALAYADADRIPEWAYTAVAAASDMGIIAGRDDGHFAPVGYTTRAEAVTLILRIVDRL